MANQAPLNGDGSRRFADDCMLPMAARLMHAAERFKKRHAGDRRSITELRSEQLDVYADFGEYLLDVALRSEGQNESPFARIIQPPRTGKTVIAGEIIGSTEFVTLFVVPTKILVRQAERDLREQLPDVPIGVYFSEEKRIVAGGIVITTYSILQEQWKNGTLPPALRMAALIFCDEGHHSMTEDRLNMLRNAFDPLAIRIALTATPTYNEERALARFFPHLIHEITLPEAVELELLAPACIWVAEVDVNASVVKITSGEFQQEVLGRLMSAAPFFKAAEVFRYSEENVGVPALITCVSRQQAYDLVKYLTANRPAGSPAPALIIDDTREKDRERILNAFEAGRIDTIVSVGVLVEGWNSPTCKILIDLAPSLSIVRATQKFCRVLTKFGDAEGRIYMILPKGLQRMPIMPTELLAPDLKEYLAGDLIGSSRARTQRPRTSGVLRHPRQHPVEGVELKGKITIEVRLEKPKLDPKKTEDVRRVLRSNPEFDLQFPPSYFKFRTMFFRHDLFTGRADHLMRFLGFPAHLPGYHPLLLRYTPEGLASRLLAESRSTTTGSCRSDVRHLLEEIRSDTPTSSHRTDAESGWRALAGSDYRVRTPEEVIMAEELIYLLHQIIANFPPSVTEIYTAIVDKRVLPRSSDVEGMSMQELADLFGMKRQNMERYEERLMLYLRRALEAYERGDADAVARYIPYVPLGGQFVAK